MKMCELSKQKCIFIFILIFVVTFLVIELVTVTGQVKLNGGIYLLKRAQPAHTKTPTGNDTLSAPRQHVTNKDQVWIQHESRRERKRHIAKLCHEYPVITKHTRVKGTLAKNNTVFYCGIPKVGSTFLRNFMPQALNCSEYSTCFKGIGSYVSQGEYVAKELISHAYSFMFIREPYHRLFSAYENKLFHPNEFWRNLGVPVIKTVRRNATELNKQLGHDVTFAELVEYVAINHDMGISINEHLAPMHNICNPCSVNFDFIGRLETMSDDMESIVNDWKHKGIISKNTKPARKLETQIRYRQSFGRIGHMFKTLHKHKSQVSRYKLFQRTWSSYQIRGLILKYYEMPFTEKEVGQIDERRYKLAIENALNKSQNFPKELKSQREESFIEAYSTVPMDLLFRLREFMKPDCLLFGYDDKPEVIFNGNNLNTSNSFTYFKGI